MSNIDKRVINNQQLKAFITGFLSDPAHDNQSSRSLTAEVFRIALASLEASPAPEWTNEQCLEFLSIAFRHAEIKGDLELDDIRLGVKMVNGSRAAMLQGADGNSPVLPDGWVMVPVEPTYQMCKAIGLPWESPRFPDRYKAMISAVKQ